MTYFPSLVRLLEELWDLKKQMEGLQQRNDELVQGTIFMEKVLSN